MTAWHRWHQRGALQRWTLKTVAFLLLLAVTLYPRLGLAPTWIQRLGHMNSVLDPQHPALAPLEEQVRAATLGTNDPQALLETVQEVVHQQIPYACDWAVWGVMDFLPTVDEVFQQGREDCDGRAVVAASLLRRMGVEAWLVSDVLHVWVETPAGETMNPTGGAKILASGSAAQPAEQQTRINLSPGLVFNLARGISYGVAAFPLLRELIILSGLCLLTMHPWSSGWRRLCGCLLLWIALGQVRDSGMDAAMQGNQAAVQAAVGFLLALLGWLCLAVRAAARRPNSAAALPE